MGVYRGSSHNARAAPRTTSAGRFALPYASTTTTTTTTAATQPTTHAPSVETPIAFSPLAITATAASPNLPGVTTTAKGLQVHSPKAGTKLQADIVAYTSPPVRIPTPALSALQVLARRHAFKSKTTDVIMGPKSPEASLAGPCRIVKTHDGTTIGVFRQGTALCELIELALRLYDSSPSVPSAIPTASVPAATPVGPAVLSIGKRKRSEDEIPVVDKKPRWAISTGQIVIASAPTTALVDPTVSIPPVPVVAIPEQTVPVAAAASPTLAPTASSHPMTTEKAARRHAPKVVIEAAPAAQAKNVPVPSQSAIVGTEELDQTAEDLPATAEDAVFVGESAFDAASIEAVWDEESNGDIPELEVVDDSAIHQLTNLMRVHAILTPIVSSHLTTIDETSCSRVPKVVVEMAPAAQVEDASAPFQNPILGTEESAENLDAAAEDTASVSESAFDVECIEVVWEEESNGEMPELEVVDNSTIHQLTDMMRALSLHPAEEPESADRTAETVDVSVPLAAHTPVDDTAAASESLSGVADVENDIECPVTAEATTLSVETCGEEGKQKRRRKRGQSNRKEAPVAEDTQPVTGPSEAAVVENAPAADAIVVSAETEGEEKKRKRRGKRGHPKRKGIPVNEDTQPIAGPSGAAGVENSLNTETAAASGVTESTKKKRKNRSKKNRNATQTLAEVEVEDTGAADST
ncbi:hypothetical protein FRB95_008812 [Tulasnella sp. JGI-2019a]|nr:hypothetical protein FRB95_008812 [Tulasnella sp. JGI-2019a]